MPEYPTWALVEAKRRGVHPREIVNITREDIAEAFADAELGKGYRPDEHPTDPAEADDAGDD